MQEHIQLNSRWRVNCTDDIQWILEYRRRKPTAKQSGYAQVAFCTLRSVLIRNVEERCGDVSAIAMAQLFDLPKQHQGFQSYVETRLKEAGVVA